jgi:hypothetical protein
MRKPLLAPPQMMYVAQTLLRACSITTVTRSSALHLERISAPWIVNVRTNTEKKQL